MRSAKVTKLVRIGLTAIPCAMLLSSGVAQAQGEPPIVARAEQCLRRNVDRIVAIEPNIDSAASFLVNFACAPEVAGAARYRRNLAYLQAVTTMTQAMNSMSSMNSAAQAAQNPSLSAAISATVDPETGEFILPKHVPGQPQNMFETMLPQMSMANAQILPDVAPTDLRKLAGDLVLAAKEQRGKQR